MKPRLPRRPLRVLVVEDHADTASSVELFLRLSGVEVWTAADGPAALQTAAEFPPDVVLLDIGLPGMDGYDVARRLAAQFPNGKPYLVAVTGYGTEADRRRAADAGFDRHLLKPADPEELMRLVTGFLPGEARPAAAPS
jgi:CheY-like chemotaxis protein